VSDWGNDCLSSFTPTSTRATQDCASLANLKIEDTNLLSAVEVLANGDLSAADDSAQGGSLRCSRRSHGQIPPCSELHRLIKANPPLGLSRMTSVQSAIARSNSRLPL
jgi:hypothetical protein